MSAVRLALLLVGIALVPLLLYAAPPWWSQHNVLVQNATSDDYAPANQGQLKNIATAAIAEMDAKLTGGAGEELHNLVNNWSIAAPSTNDFAPVNLGQLKKVAQPFYDRLIALGIVDYYPWLKSANPPDDFAVANIGQIKELFSFAIPAANILDDPIQDRLAVGQRAGSLALEAQAVWFWGSRFVADNSFQNSYPRRVAGLSNIRSVSVGDDYLVVLTGDGHLLTWGKNYYGQLGDGTTSDHDAPIAIPNLSNIRAVKAGSTHTLALQSDGTILAWGDNYYGELTGDSPSSSSPIQVAGLTNVHKIAAGASRSVALEDDGTVWTWGYDHYASQTGQDIFSATPTQVPGLLDVIEIAAGYEHVVALKSDGTVWAWGSRYANQLGNGTSFYDFQQTPVQVPGLPNITKIACGFDHTLAIASDGTVWTWGTNRLGTLGDGTTEPRQTPVHVNGLTDVIAIAATSNCSMAMKSDGTVWAWGDGASGTLPNVDLHVPQQVGLGLFDPNHNGMDDRWEMEYFGNLDQLADADFDGDGISNLKECLRGTNPRDYFSGITPVIEMVSGNNQVGDPGTVLPKPLIVRVRDASGKVLVNAPVEFKVTSGAATFAVAPVGPFQENLIGRTDSSGQCSGYVMLAQMPGISTRVTVSPAIFSNFDAPSVSYRVVNRFVLPPSPTPTPDPNNTPSPSATPGPTASPPLPYRYAIIDLGKDRYPTRVNNKGWVLLYGITDGNTRYHRWKAGVLETLNYAGPASAFSATDMNDEGTVVGSDEALYNRTTGWVNNRLNDLGTGLIWPADSNTTVRFSAPTGLSWNPLRPGSIREAYFSAIANRNSTSNQANIYGGSYEGEGGCSLFDIHVPFEILNARRWSSDLAASANLSSSRSTILAVAETFAVFIWSGPMDRISRANSSGHYIGSRITPFGDARQGGISGSMVDGQDTNFDPADINEKAMVVGSNGAGMVLRVPGQTDLVFAGAYPIAINDHAQPAPSTALQSSPAPTPVAAPQILAWVGNALALWELQADGSTWHPFGLEEMIPSMDGWEYLTPSDMNDNGLIVGTGWYTDPSNPSTGGEQHGFMLVPCELMVDGNRDGEMSFDDASVRAADETTEDRPYRFWVNDDDDGASDDRVPPLAPDYADGVIRCIRDLEDFTRLYVNVSGFEQALESGSIKAAFEWKDTPNDPRIKLYRAAKPGTEYLTSESDASALTISPFNETLGEVVSGTPLFLPQGFWVRTSAFSNVPKTLPFALLLFEASREGKGRLVLTLWQDNRRIGETPGVWLDLKEIRKMYQRAIATPESLTPPYESNSSTFDDASVSYRPDISPRFEPPTDEDEKCLIFVHGWKPTEASAANAGQTMFKRLWWEGFKGRFATFRWPTLTSNFSYNTSEWLAWKYGKSLNDYVTKYVKQQVPDYTISIAAHSMGNIVTGSALRRGLVLDNYLMMEAAIPAGCYDDRVNNYEPFLIAESETATPDTVGEMGYRLLLQPFRQNVANVVSFFNVGDYALATGSIGFIPGWPIEVNWEKNQASFKPDTIGGGLYRYQGVGASYFETPHDGTTRQILDLDESLSFVARPRSRAAGAEIHNASVFGSVLNLQTTCGFGEGVNDHSGQFSRPIQQLKPFYTRMMDELTQ